MVRCYRQQLLDKELRNCAQGTILQCQDGDRLRFAAQIKWQHFYRPVDETANADAGRTNAPSFERRYRSSLASHSPSTSIPMAKIDQTASPNAAARFV